MPNFKNNVQKISTLVNSYQNEKIVKNTKFIKSYVSGLSDLVKELESIYKEKSDLNKGLNIGIIGAMKSSKTSSINTIMLQNSSFKLPVDALPETASIVNISYNNHQEKANALFYTTEEWAEITEKHNKYTANEKDATVNEKAASKRYVKAQTNKVTDMIGSGMLGISFTDLKDYVSDDGMYTPIVEQINITVTDPSFQQISLTDTPGLYDPNSDRSQLSDDYIKSLDVVFFFSAIDMFLTEDEMEHLIKIAKSISKIIIVASRFDRILFQIDPSKSFVTDCNDVIEQQLKAKEQLIRHFEIKYKNDNAILQILNEIRNSEVVYYSTYFARYSDNLPLTDAENTIVELKQQYPDFNKLNVEKFGNAAILEVIKTCKKETPEIRKNNLVKLERTIFTYLTNPLQKIITETERHVDFIMANNDLTMFREKKRKINLFISNHKNNITTGTKSAFDTYINTVNKRINDFIKSFDVSIYQQANRNYRTERRLVSYTYFLWWEWNKVYENVTITEGDVLATKQKVSDLANNINSIICSIVNEFKNKLQKDINSGTVKQLSQNNELLKNSLKTVFKDAPTDIKEILYYVVDNIVDTIEPKEFVGVLKVDLSPFNRFGNNAKAEPTALDSVAEKTVDNFMSQQKGAISKYQTDWREDITRIKNDFSDNIFSKIDEELNKLESDIGNSEEVIKKQRELIKLTRNYIAKCQ
jgi:hypothetical protein